LSEIDFLIFMLKWKIFTQKETS